MTVRSRSAVTGATGEYQRWAGRNLASLLTLCGSSSLALTMDSEGFCGLLGQSHTSKR
jgi:hypothetical protein